jgi:hypothetical protein
MQENPELEFADYAVTIHVAAERSDSSEPAAGRPIQHDDSISSGIEQIERDILSYAFRNDPPLATVWSVPTGIWSLSFRRLCATDRTPARS